MAASKEDIRRWLQSAKQNAKNTHVVIVTDTWDYDDYPVNVSSDEKVQDVIANYRGKSMQSVMEVYNLSLDIEEQLFQHRVWNI